MNKTLVVVVVVVMVGGGGGMCGGAIFCDNALTDRETCHSRSTTVSKFIDHAVKAVNKRNRQPSTSRRRGTTLVVHHTMTGVHTPPHDERTTKTTTKTQ